MTADPIDAAVRRGAAAFAVAAPELDPRSPAGYGPWRAALEAAELAALARVAELEVELTLARGEKYSLAAALVDSRRDAGAQDARATAAEAAVERVRAELDDATAEIVARAEHHFGGGISEAVRQGMARVANGIRAALDAAGTPATPEPPL